MTVVPFSVARFTPADLVEFYRIVLPDCARGVWSGIVRETGCNSDRLVITAADGELALTVERDESGDYHLYHHGPNGAGCIASAPSIRECLASWQRLRSEARRRPSLALIDAGSVPGQW